MYHLSWRQIADAQIQHQGEDSMAPVGWPAIRKLRFSHARLAAKATADPSAALGMTTACATVHGRRAMRKFTIREHRVRRAAWSGGQMQTRAAHWRGAHPA